MGAQVLKTVQNTGGIETGSMYMQYVQGINSNIPAGTTFIEIYRLFLIRSPIYGRDSENDFRFPDIASYTSRFHFVWGISSLIYFWVDIRQLSKHDLQINLLSEQSNKSETKP